MALTPAARYPIDLARIVGFRNPTFPKKSGFLAKLANRIGTQLPLSHQTALKCNG
jgi:hypothetical protein